MVGAGTGGTTLDVTKSKVLFSSGVKASDITTDGRVASERTALTVARAGMMIEGVRVGTDDDQNNLATAEEVVTPGATQPLRMLIKLIKILDWAVASIISEVGGAKLGLVIPGEVENDVEV